MEQYKTSRVHGLADFMLPNTNRRIDPLAEIFAQWFNRSVP